MLVAHDTSQWLVTGLSLSRVIPDEAMEVKLVAAWLLATAAEIPKLPPPGVVSDIGYLLCGAQLKQAGVPSKAIRRYEDILLGRLVTDPKFRALIDATARLQPYQKVTAVGYVVAAIVQRIGYTEGYDAATGLLRRLSRGIGIETVENYASDDAAYVNLVAAAESSPTLVTDSDIFVVENLDVMCLFSSRVGATQVIDAAEWLSVGLPKHRQQHCKGAVVATPSDDESTYPAGGYASISNSGSIENLVPSELAYMEPRRSHTIDAFDLRWAEGELLYYTRDEAIFVRGRRHIVLDVGVLTHTKTKGMQWQDSVVALGQALVLIREIAKHLTEEALLLEVIVRLDQERKLFALLTKEWQERGVLKIVANTPELTDTMELVKLKQHNREEIETVLHEVL